MAQRKHQKKSPTKQAKPEEEIVSDKRALWKGYISFGLVNIPVMLYSAQMPTEEVHFKLLAKDNLAGIKYARINEITQKEVPWEDIVKGYEYEPGNYAILTEEDFNEIAKENQKVIEIEDFVDREKLGTMYFEKPYYLLPNKGGAKGYVLLRETLKNTNKVGIARVMIRSHQYLAALLVQDNALIINTLRYPQEVKKATEVGVPSEPVSNYKISKKEFDIAKQLVDTMTINWDPKRYTNEYRQELLKLIEEKIATKGKKVIKHIEKAEFKQTNVVDFMDLLKKSIQKQKSTKSPPTKSSKSGSKKKSR
ncbi:MAG: Ku protein [Proteobacteria bacterium]|nr:Ku protein [Pseudomonadota bacterium]